MNRYILHVSYMGTQFRGVQKIFNRAEPDVQDSSTVQGVLEMALRKLNSVNEPAVVASSRTDAGVHALHSTFHVDLERRSDTPYQPDRITTILNKHFNGRQLHIRVLKCAMVPRSFHCRYDAISRTYAYRLGIIDDPNNKGNTHLCHIPIQDYARCHYICDSIFDVEHMMKVSKLFLGKHDFRTFMGRGSHHLDKITRRTFEELEISRGSPDATFQGTFKRDNFKCDYWNVVVRSEGFLYNQVRRVVGTLIAAGQRRISSQQVTLMLQVPSHNSWEPRVVPAPSHGLYLCRVRYPPGLEALWSP